MYKCKIVLNKYRKLQKKHNKYYIIYSSYEHKGLCREDAMCNIDINEKIKVKKIGQTNIIVI